MANKGLEGKSEFFSHIMDDLGLPLTTPSERDIYKNSCNCVGNCGCTKSCGGYVDPELERQYHLSEEHGD